MIDVGGLHVDDRPAAVADQGIAEERLVTGERRPQEKSSDEMDDWEFHWTDGSGEV